ncbi:conserved hypothetical protein [Neospora caninum Liverpool]|uniref:Uncharacterized protein n=1 Tax=Neospora caninum (strain Liverpool) TaxID=572307 RepID=F0VDM4_NEOCL|nr:conserved hypothetical protein [Neospora caninum Liverpool]CBZ51817.1 conserved hypothetical protein [Neospora caninum Liverpool]|eukprot:XP_003881850.1 conserved hypothetical protein [Neospora caninum Liverpool]
MAELMLDWVNSFPLSRKATNLERDFASGFLFGELLAAAKQLETVDGFVDSSSASAVVANFRLLEPVFRRLDVKCDSLKMQAVIEKQEGAALRLLFQLKVALSRFSRNCGRSSADLSRILKTSANRPAFETFQERFIEARLKDITKPSKETCMQSRKTFEAPGECSPETRPAGSNAQGTTASRRIENSRECPSPTRQLACTDFHRSQHDPRKADARDCREGVSEATSPRDHRGRTLRKPKREEKEGTGARDPGGERDERDKRREVEAGLLRRRVFLEARVRDERRSKAEAKLRETRDAVKKDIESFEMNLQRLGLSHSGTAGAVASSEGLSPSAVLASLARRLPPSSVGREENLKTLARLHAARSAQETARKEREKRRQKLLIEQTQAHADLFAEAVAEGVFRRLRRLSQRAESVEESVWKVQQLDAVMSQNRELRTQQLERAERRSQQTREAREDHVALEAQERLRRDVALEAQQCREWQKHRRARRRARLIEECSHVLDLLLDLSVAAARFHQARDVAAVDSRTWRLWLVSFVEGCSALPSQVPHTPPLFLAESTGEKTSPKSRFAGFGPRQIAGNGKHPGETLGDANKTGEETARSCFHRLVASQEFLGLSGPSEGPAGQARSGHAPEEALAPQRSLFQDADDSLRARLDEDDFYQYLNYEGQFDPEASRKAAPDAFAFLHAHASGEEATKRLFASEVLQELFKFNEASAPIDWGRRDFAAGPNGEPSLCRLGSIVGALLDLMHPEAPMQTPEDVPNGLRIVITGKPFSGKKTLARKLSQKFRLQMFSLEDVLKESLQGIENRLATETQPVEAPSLAPSTEFETPSAAGQKSTPSQSPTNLSSPSSPPSPVSSASSSSASSSSSSSSSASSPGVWRSSLRELGLEAFEALRNGEKLSNRLAVSLLVAKMRETLAEVDRDALAHLLELGSAKAAGEVAAKERTGPGRAKGQQKHGKEKVQKDPAVDDPSQKLGCVLVGFPQTYEQCVYLEERLSGYVAPDRRLDSRARLEKAKASLVVPIPEVPHIETSLIPGGVDLHILLDVPTEEALRRARTTLQSQKTRGESRGILGNTGSKTPTDDSAAAHAKISMADECCHFEIEQKVTRLFLERFGSADVEGVLARKRREFGVESGSADYGRAPALATEENEKRPLPSESEEKALEVVARSSTVSPDANARSGCASAQCRQVPPETLDEGALWRTRLEPLEESVKLFLLEEWKALEENYTSVMAKVRLQEFAGDETRETRWYLSLEGFATDACYNMMGACMPERKQAPDVSHALREISLTVAQQVAASVFSRQPAEGAPETPATPWQALLLEAKARECLVPLSDFEDYVPYLQEPEKKKAAKAKPVKDEVKKPVDSLFFELQHLQLQLQVQLLARVRKACVWGIARLHETASACSEVFACMDDWIVGKCLAEHAAVKELTDRLKICIENERPVPHYLELAGTELHLDPNAILSTPTQVLPPLRIVDIPEDLFTVKQIKDLIWDLKRVTTNGIVSTVALREILLRRLTHSKCFRTPHLPKTWLSIPASQLSLLPDYFDVSSGSVDPLEFLLSLALGARGWPSARQLLQLRSSAARVCTARGRRSSPWEASPLEVFASKEDFFRLDFSDWIPREDASRAEAREDDCGLFKDEVPAEGRDLLEVLFEIFLAFQSKHNLRACSEEIAVLEEMGYWKEDAHSASATMNPSTVPTHMITGNDCPAATTISITPCVSKRQFSTSVSPRPGKAPSFDCIDSCSAGGEGEARSGKSSRNEQNTVAGAKAGARSEDASDEERPQTKCAEFANLEADDEGGRHQNTGKIYVRRFLGYLSLGKTPAEGMQRFLAACTERDSLTSPPELSSADSLSVRDAYTACLFMGVRPALRALPACTELSFEEFRTLLLSQGKIVVADRSALGGEEGNCADGAREERVGILDFMSSSAAAETLSRVGYLSVRRDVKDFLAAGANERNNDALEADKEI